MRYLIESLDNCCSQRTTTSSSSSSQDSNVIQKIFGGQLRSQVKCTVCSTCSNTYDPFLDLSLEIVRADSLTKALNRFTALEALDGDNEYYCATCQKKGHALKQFTIDKAPIILTIQFMRFSGISSSGGKIDKKIDFGRTLAMKPYISNPEACDANYSLYAVLVHAGWSTCSGHYYCFVRTARGLWHNLDDSQVRQVSEKTVLDQKAYILFYMQDLASQSPPGGEQIGTNSAPILKSNWYSQGTFDVENDMDRGNDKYEGEACQSSKQQSISCNSSSHLYSKESCQEAHGTIFRHST